MRMRHATRHATPHENVGAIGNLDAQGADLVLRGVASGSIDPYATSGYAQTVTQTIATSPYSAVPSLAALVADQITPGLADRTGPGAFQRLQDWHVIPAGVIAGALICGAESHHQPLHAWFGGGFTAAGIAATAVYGAVHVARAINGEDEGSVSGGVHVIGLGGIGLAAFGIASISGASPLTAGVGIGLLTAGYYAWFQTRHSRLQDQRGFLVGHTAAATPAVLGMPGGIAAPVAAPVAGQLASHEEAIVYRAFADMGIEPITLRAFERIDKDAFNVIVGLPGSRADDPESVVRRSETLKSNLRATQIAVEALPDQGNEVALMARFGSASPILETIPWPGPQTDDVTQPIRMGLTHYGSPVMVHFAKRHTLFAGKTRRGKSAGVQVAVCSIGATRNGQLWFLDLKPGQLALGPFEPLSAQFADTLPKAALLIAAAVAAMEENGEILKEERERTGVPVWEWDPAVHGSGIFLVIDELADFLRLDPEIYEQWLRLMQLGAGLGVYIIGATQSPSAKALGNSTDGGSQFGDIFGYQAKGATQAGVIFGQGAWGEGWKPSERNLPLQGMFLLRSPEHTHPVVSRGDFIEPNSAMRIAAEIADGQLAQLHPRTQAAVDRVLAMGVPEGTGPEGARPAGGQPQDARPYGRPRLVTLYPDGTKVDPRHEDMWDLLGSLGERGATVGDLSLAAKRAGHERCSLAWVRDLCKNWRTAGNVMVEEGKEPRYWRDDDTLKRRARQEA
jgi:hypothetical protein